MASSSPSIRTGAGGQSTSAAGTLAGDHWARELAESLRVTREGFEFRVTYRTRFGETKTDKLPNVLEAFQNMRAFEPHVNLQKSGIRLVVTRWDGETFVEEPGIENVEHASPEQVEELIRNHLAGAPERTSAGAGPVRSHGPAPVVRIEVVRRPHEPRFHLRLHRQDGHVEDGPMLLRVNMPKVAGEKWFQAGVTLSMSALSDGITITHAARDAASGFQTESLPLQSDSDAQNVEALLNRILRSPDVALTAPNPPAGASPVSEAQPQPAPALPSEAAPAVPQTPQLAATPPAAAEPVRSGPAASEHVAPPPAVPKTKPEASPTDPQLGSDPKPVPTVKGNPPTPKISWLRNIVGRAEQATPDQITKGVFFALEQRFERAATVNEHGFPSFALEFLEKPGTVARIELVLTPHYLLCGLPFGYARFGAETRLFLNRTDDYLEGPGFALRGVAETHPPGGLIFVVSDALARFLASQTDRSYQNQFADLLRAADRVQPEERLLWPRSREDELFDLVSAQAREYQLPVTPESVVLAPTAPEFIGFKRCAPHGIEFRDGEEYIRFSPAGVEWKEAGTEERSDVVDVLSGWALDGDGRVCAICKTECGFVPPEETKLVRFIREEALGQDESGLTILGLLSKVGQET